MKEKPAGRGTGGKTIAAVLARRCRLSEATVRNILSGRNKEVWPSVKARAERVRRLASELGYRPNTAARAMASGCFGAVGLVTCAKASRGGLFEPFLNGVQQELKAAGLSLVLNQVDDEDIARGILPQVLRELSVDGLVISCIAGMPESFPQLVERSGLPAIWCNVDRDIDCVSPDDQGAARDAARILLELGHRRVAWIGRAPGTEPHYSLGLRRDAFVAAIEAAGGTVENLVMPEEVRTRLPAVRRRLAADPIPTAILAFSEDDAMPVLMAAGALGIGVPERLSVLCFHRQTLVAPGFPVATLEIPFQQMGREAVAMLREKLFAPGASLPARRLPFRLRPGDTLGTASRPPAAKGHRT